MSDSIEQDVIIGRDSIVKIVCQNCEKEVAYHWNTERSDELGSSSGLAAYGVEHPNFCPHCGSRLRPMFSESDFIDLPEGLAANIFKVQGVEFTPVEWLLGHVTQISRRMNVNRENLEDLAAALNNTAVLPEDASPLMGLLNHKVRFWKPS